MLPNKYDICLLVSLHVSKVIKGEESTDSDIETTKMKTYIKLFETDDN